MADIVFAFDPAIDRPVPVPESAPAAVTGAVAAATVGAFEAAVATARTAAASALVVCGRLLDPERASPAQAAHVRRLIQDLAAHGCTTVVVVGVSTTDAPLPVSPTTACHDLARMLGEPRGLAFVTPLAGLRLTIHGIPVEIVSAHGPPGTTVGGDAAALERRIIIGWDEALFAADRWGGFTIGELRAPRSRAPDDDVERLPDIVEPPRSATAFAAAAAAEAAWSHPGTLWIWGTRRVGRLPAGLHHLPPLQARSSHESHSGACCTLSLVDFGDEEDAVTGRRVPVPRGAWRASWREVPTHRVRWRTLSIESPAGGDEELAAAIWSALESVERPERAASAGEPPLEMVRCSIECGTSVARRVRIAELAAETLARVRQLAGAKSAHVWCREVFAAPGESLAPLGHARSGGRPGSTTSFSSALADIVNGIEQDPVPPIPADLAREAGWLALELVETT